MEAFKRKERGVSRRRQSRATLFFGSILVLCLSTAHIASANEPYSPDSLLGFIQHLYKNQEYYRAFVELERLEAYWPGHLEAGRVHVARMAFLMKGNKYDEVLKENKMKEAPFACADTIFRFDARLYLSSIIPSADCAIESGGRCDDFFGPFFWKREFVSAVVRGDEKAALHILSESIFPEVLSEQKEKYRSIAEKAHLQREHMRDPYVALFAGLIPGLGYYTAGNKSTGVLACIVVGVFSALTVAAFKTDNAPIGIVLGSVTGFFYGGSILGGYMTAKRNNAQVEKNLLRTVIEDASLEADRDMIFEKFGLPR